MNKYFFAAGLLALSSLFAGNKNVQVQESAKGMKLHVGASYRSFDDIDFKSRAAMSFKGIQGAGVELQAYETGKTLIEASDFMNVAEVVYFEGGTRNGSGDVDGGDCFSPSIGVSWQVWGKEALTVSVVAGFQYYDIDGSTGAGYGAEYSTYQTKIPGIPMAPERDPHETDYLTGSAKADMDMALYVLDLGVRSDYAVCDKLSLFASLGPSLSVADMESSSSISVSANGGSLASSRVSDASTEFIFGVYASAGVQYMFTERIGASLEVRYDEGFNKASTQIASQDLDGFGGMLKLVFAF